MLLIELINDLVANELWNIADGKDIYSNGPTNYNRLTQCVSAGVTEIHKRFPLRKEIITLETVEGINRYVIGREHCESNASSTEVKYIKDALHPYMGGLTKIEQLIGENDPTTFVEFNSTRADVNIYLLDYKTIVITDPVDKERFQVRLRTSPAPIRVESTNALESYVIDVPETYREALVLYAAARALNNRGGENATNNESAIFYARFEAACAMLESTGSTDREAISIVNRFKNRGFV